MNFQNLSHIETADAYLDRAFRKAKTQASTVRSKKRDSIGKLDLLKNTEIARLDVIANYIRDTFTYLQKTYPHVQECVPFYRELMHASFDVADYRTSLAALLWCAGKITLIQRDYARRMRGARNTADLHKMRKEYYGRISSFVKQVGPNLRILEQARRTLKRFPDIKTSMRTIAIVGFPNVGKTTLLAKITGSSAQIANYPFTTVGINVAYSKEEGSAEKTQWIDTPGTLNRTKNNPIEMHAELILKHVAQEIVYVFDVSESSYPLADQLALYARVKKIGKPLLVYFSKTDIAPQTADALRKKLGSVEEFSPASLKK